MRKAVILGLACALAAAPAMAQTTKCGWEFGKWVCRTAQAPAQADIVGAGAQAYRDTDAMIQSTQRRQAEARIADLVRAGRCAEAKDLALRIGDMNLADQAARLCAN